MNHPEDLRHYHRHAILYVLQGGDHMTAAETHEAVTAMAMANAHPKECSTITPAGIAGLLRSLQSDGLVTPRGDRHNTRHGRTEPTWAAAGEAKYMDVPGAPLNRRPGRAALDSTDPMAGLSREQLLAMLLVGDELSAATARFQAEVEGIKDRARRVLAVGSIS